MKKDDRRDAGQDRAQDGVRSGKHHHPAAAAPGAGFGPGGYGGYGEGSQHGGESDSRRDGDSWSPSTLTHGLDASESAPESTAELGGDARAAAGPTQPRTVRAPAADGTVEGKGRWQRAAITAGDIMTRDLRSANETTTAAEIARIMKEENCGVVPVIDDDGTLVGMVTDRDLVLRVAAAGKPFDTTPASEAMTDEVEAVTVGEELENVIELMGRKQIRRVPVVDGNDKLLGIVSMSDVANRADYQDLLEEALERVSSKRGYWSRLG